MHHDIFLSYSHTDQEIADRFIQIGSSRGLSVWYDKLILGGQDWRGAIVEALSQSTIMLIFFSDATNKSAQLIKELAIADRLGKLVMPVLVEDIEPSGAYLYEMATRNWIYLHPEPTSRLEWLVENLWQRIHTISDGRALAAAAVPQAPAGAIPGSAPTLSGVSLRSSEPQEVAPLLPRRARHSWFPLRYYDLFILGPILIGDSIWAVSTGADEGLGLNLFAIALYMFVLAFRNARMNKGIFSISSFISYALVGFLIVPFGLFPDWLAGLSKAEDYPDMLGGFILLSLMAGGFANVVQVMLRRALLRRIFREKIGETSPRQAAA